MSITVAGVGEVLWDVLPGGRRLGGAPANFACHAMALGADAAIVSAVGDDNTGTSADVSTVSIRVSEAALAFPARSCAASAETLISTGPSALLIVNA